MKPIAAIVLALLFALSGCGYKGKLKTPAQIEHAKAKKARQEAKKQRQQEQQEETPDDAEHPEE